MTKKLILPLLGLFIITVFFYFSFLTVFPKQVESLSGSSEVSVSQILDLLPSPAPYPFFQTVTPLPDLTAESIYALDADSMVTLYEKNADKPLLPASTTKIMTALVALESYRLDQLLSFDGAKIEGNGIGLKSGEQMTVENLLYGALVGSGNDAAYALASNYPSGLTGFIGQMNRRAEELNLFNTHFINPVGLDQEGQYSTARDLARLSVVALKNQDFARIVATPRLTISDLTGRKIYNLINTNDLILEDSNFKGIKTGQTENAGECLVALYKNSHQIIMVVLRSPNRSLETKKLTGWILENFVWKTITPQLSYR